MKNMCRLIGLSALLILPYGCRKADPTPGVVLEVIRYFHGHQFQEISTEHSKVVFLAGPATFDSAPSKPVMESIYASPRAEWLAACAGLSFTVRPVSDCDFDPRRNPPFYYERGTGVTAVVFSIIKLDFINKTKAVVKASAAFAPLAGGETAYTVEYVNGQWTVTSAQIGAVY